MESAEKGRHALPRPPSHASSSGQKSSGRGHGVTIGIDDGEALQGLAGAAAWLALQHGQQLEEMVGVHVVCLDIRQAPLL
jgi:hypothetical protein